ncbi:MAG: oligosaccharide repeat unit polymerase [Bacteroidaceae bacterium]|nr:oligosaccharide repeat unit polymerase [Bacteroidaceae bacterium]
MILVPFLYFTGLTFFWWKKHQGMDICVYMSALYAFISLCAVIIVTFDLLAEAGILFDRYDYEIGVVPTLLYCLLLTLGMLPFSFIYRNDIQTVKRSDSWILDATCWLLFFVFLLNVYLIIDSTAEILAGDLSNVRQDHYNGIQSPAEIKAESLPIYIRLFFWFNTSTCLALPLFFYYSCFTNRSWWFKLMVFCTSLSMPLSGLQVADRTEFTLFGMMFIYCLIFFWKFLSKRFKYGIMAVGTPMIGLIITYLVAVTQARFSENSKDDEKAYASVVQYAGQSFLNFCYFWENGRFEYISPEREFPMTWHLLFHVDSNADRRAVREAEQGFFMSVFATYIGDVMLDLSPVGVIVWSIGFVLICLLLIRYSHREVYDMGDVLAIFMLAVVPIFGVFYYRYYSYMSFFNFSLVAIIYFTHKVKIVIHPTEKQTPNDI